MIAIFANKSIFARFLVDPPKLNMNFLSHRPEIPYHEREGSLMENERFAATPMEYGGSSPLLVPNSARLSRITALVVHPWMGFGGSEATTMWTIQALQSQGALVTFVTSSEFDPSRFNRVYGTSVDPAHLNVRRAPRLPGVNNGTRLALLQGGVFQSYCRKIAPEFDLCVSAYNLVDFGRPAIQLIGDYTWSETLRRAIDPDADRLPRHRDHFVRRLYLSGCDLIRGHRGIPLAARGDLVLANSDWTRDILATESVGLPDCPVVFPPVMYSSPPPTGAEHLRAPLSFACLGRISPEKRIESAIRILARVREAGQPITLAIAGAADDAAYGNEISKLVASHAQWAHLTGFLDSEKRDRLLASTAFGIHTRPAEAFGIAVAEMAGYGCIPFVPDMGGPAEIVEDPRLRFRSEDEAVEKILAFLSRPDSHEELRRGLVASMTRFRPECFMETLLDHVERFLETHGCCPGIINPSAEIA